MNQAAVVRGKKTELKNVLSRLLVPVLATMGWTSESDCMSLGLRRLSLSSKVFFYMILRILCCAGLQCLF